MGLLLPASCSSIRIFYDTMQSRLGDLSPELQGQLSWQGYKFTTQHNNETLVNIY